MVITLVKPRLLELLNESLARAEKEDARALKAHRKDEAAALVKFRDKLGEALRWDYQKAKNHDFKAGLGYEGRPSCPRSKVPEIKRIIRCVQADGRKSPFHVKTGTDVELALNWLPPHERPKESVCE